MLLAFNVVGSTAYSYNTPVPDLDPRNYEYLKGDQNTSALYLEETSARTLGQVNSKNDQITGNYLIWGKDFFNRRCLVNNKLTSIIIQDKKEILKASIFPFHFFW